MVRILGALFFLFPPTSLCQDRGVGYVATTNISQVMFFSYWVSAITYIQKKKKYIEDGGSFTFTIIIVIIGIIIRLRLRYRQ